MRWWRIERISWSSGRNSCRAIRIKPNPDCHDRLIVFDYCEETEKVYHCGASSKDAGKKLCAIHLIIEVVDVLRHLCLNVLIQQDSGQSQVINLQIKTEKK